MKDIFKTGLGQDSHRFLRENSTKPCIIAGIVFEDTPGLDADSDGDVVFHSICNAITSITGVPILATIARDLCLKDGITDSKIYLQKALQTLKNHKISHIAISIEAKKPRFDAKIMKMRESVAKVMNLDISQVGITVTSGDGLTDFGLGEGIQVFCIISVVI